MRHVWVEVSHMGLCTECVALELGVCRQEDYCRQESRPLMEEARQLAQALGHEMGEFFRWRKGYSVFEARCEQCGMTIRIDVNPGPGEKHLCGDAGDANCREP